MGFVKRKATTKAKNTRENNDAVKSDFLFEIKVIVALEEIQLLTLTKLDLNMFQSVTGLWKRWDPRKLLLQA